LLIVKYAITVLKEFNLNNNSFPKSFNMDFEQKIFSMGEVLGNLRIWDVENNWSEYSINNPANKNSIVCTLITPDR